VSIESRPQRRLFVEGNNDLHAVVEIARRLHPETPSWFQEDLIKDAGSDTRALKLFQTAIKVQATMDSSSTPTRPMASASRTDGAPFPS